MCFEPQVGSTSGVTPRREMSDISAATAAAGNIQDTFQ